MSLRNIDAVVASKFMDMPCRWMEIPFYSVSDYLLLHGEGQHQCAAIPAFSSDIGAAMLVWQRLRESGVWCCLSLDSDYSYCWIVKLTKSLQRGGDHKKPEIVIDGIDGGPEALAYAICLAALQTIGIIPDEDVP